MPNFRLSAPPVTGPLATGPLATGTDRLPRPATPEPGRKQGDDGGPSSPDVRKPEGGNELLRRMKKIDPDQAKRYRQRSGE